jgi:PPOX class probable FMN-dependent enzyme
MNRNGVIHSVEELHAIYGEPSERARLKEITRLDDKCRAFIAASPFVLLATVGAQGSADCSPRGDQPGFVTVEDDETLLIPDRRGNNRVDSLRNIVETGAVGLLFMVPGVNETLRVNGRARLSTDPSLLDRFEVEGKLPRSVAVVTIEQAFMQCQRALVRSDLWNPERFVERSSLPSMGEILAAHTGGCVDPAAYDAETARVLPNSLY